MPASVWRGHITFGLVTIPVRLYRAARRERVKLRELYSAPEAADWGEEPDVPEPPQIRTTIVSPADEAQPKQATVEESPLAPVRRMAVEDSGRVLPSAAVTKGFEFEKGRFVKLEKAELNALVPKTSTEMELLEFVELPSVDPIYFDASYYVQAEEAGQKPYALLYESLKQTGLVGVARFAMHRREHIVIIRTGASGLVAHTMYFTSEIRANQEYKADPELVNPREVELANTLVRALATHFEPHNYKDTYREQLEKLIEAKIAGQPSAPAASPRAHKPPVDIMEALRKSLANVKKPAAREEPGRAVRKKRAHH